MRREVSLEEISDGRLYELNDMVKADWQDCAGCHDCCEGMGDSVVLDPIFLRTAYCSASDPGSVGYVRAIRIIPSLIDADMLKLMTCCSVLSRLSVIEASSRLVLLTASCEKYFCEEN